MYYAEEVINGVLCFRTSPTDRWQQYTPEQITKKYQEMKAGVNMAVQRMERMQKLLDDSQKIIENLKTFVDEYNDSNSGK